MKTLYKIFDNLYFGILLLLAVTAFIFSHSLASAENSSNESGKVVDIVTEIMDSANIEVNENTIVKTVRKTAHFSEFFALGAVCYYLRYIITKHSSTGFSLCLIYGILTSLIDESLQYNSAGRSPEVLDVWIDIAGFSFSLLILMFVFSIISKKMFKAREVRQES